MKSIASLLSILLLIGITTHSVSAENSFNQFNADVTQAYSAYRVALFQTNQKDMATSQKAVQKFQQNWDAITKTYMAAPPEVFSSDPEWEATLTSITTIAQKSLEEIKAEDLAAAHETLEAIRDELSDLRKRNSVIVFSDHINNYHEVMEGLLEEKYKPGNLDDKAIGHIRSQQGTLNYLAETIARNAPKSYQENQKYQKLQKNLFASIEQLNSALNANNPEEIVAAIAALKPAYAKIFVNFG